MGQIKFINAGAGSGKTYRLTEDFCKYIGEGAKPSEFILTTYTKAAAEEFRTKIKAKLLEKNLKDYIPLVDSAQIGTIHSVAQSYIEKYWYLLDMSPLLSIKEEFEIKEFYENVLDSIVSNDDIKFFYDYSEKLELKKGLNDKSDYWKQMVIKLVENLRLYDKKVSCLDDFKNSSLEIANEVLPEYTLDIESLRVYAEELNGYLTNVQRTRKAREFITTVNEFIKEPSIASKAGEEILTFIKDKENTRWQSEAPNEFFDEVKKCVLSDIRKDVQDYIEKVFSIAGNLYKKIVKYKKEHSILEFADLEILFKELLSKDIVKEDIKKSIKYVFVDEFQDVSPIQLEIFKSLAEIVETNYWVGDPKQAIYGFRGSDTSLARKVIDEIPKDKIEKLKTSYRSLEELVESANKMFIKAFGELDKSEIIEEEYVKLEACDKKKKEQDLYKNYKANHHWWLSLENRDGTQSTDKRNASKLYPALATKLHDIFSAKEDFKVSDTDKDGKPFLRDIKYRDVAILTRKNDNCNKIADALRAKGLPVSVLDQKFDTQAEVKLVLTLMKYIAGIDEKLTIAELRKLLKDEELEAILKDFATKQEDNDIKTLLDSLRERYSKHSVYEMVRELIAILDLRHFVGKWSYIQKRQANLDVLLSFAASFVQKKSDGTISNFIKYVAKKEIDMPFDNTGDTIKVLTYHKSKGLQWKMVILDSLNNDFLEEEDFFKKEFANISKLEDKKKGVTFNLFPPIGDFYKYLNKDKWKIAKTTYEYLEEKKRAEELRLLYVGYTRAENYVVRLSFGAVPLKWLEHARVEFVGEDKIEEISDNTEIKPSSSSKVSVLTQTHINEERKFEDKYLTPSNLTKDSIDKDLNCTISEIATNIDVKRYDIDADVFGTCVHNYMAVHKWNPNCKETKQRNLNLASNIIASFELNDYISNENIVTQADALYAHLEKEFGKITQIYNELPFSHRKDNGQILNGEIDLYVTTESGKGILVDFKNPMINSKEIDEEKIKSKAKNYWPQLSAYKDALETSNMKVNHTFIYYSMLGMLVELS